MKLESLKITGFRGISELELEFPERINVLVGVNGSGKSAVLDCAAIMLSRLIGRIRASEGTGRFFVEDDIANDVTETRNQIKVFLQNEFIQWRVSKARRGRRSQMITKLAELREHVESLRSQLEQDELPNLPLAVYYPVNRAVLDIHPSHQKEASVRSTGRLRSGPIRRVE